MDSFQQPAFSFTMPTDDFDPNRIPSDGEQYLQSVVYERNKCPAVVVKPFKQHIQIDTETHDPNISKSIWDQYTDEDLDKTPISLLPTNEWLHIQSNAFQQLHDRITQIREHLTPDYQNTDLPDDCTEVAWLDYCQQKEPLLQNMLHIHQRDLEQILEFQSNWLIDDIDWYLNNKHWYPQWVYSSLACLRLPCEANLLNSLRKIAKTCHRLRNKLNTNETTTIDSATPLSLIICIVTNNFDQFDLIGKTQS